MEKWLKIGDGVELKYNHGVVELYSNSGTLHPDWLERAGIKRKSITSIRVAEGTVFLPEDASGWDTRDDKHLMFGGLTYAKSIDLRGFDTSKVKNMRWMLNDCCELNRLDTSGMDTSGVIDMHGMFYNCPGFTSLNLRGFNTSNVKYMGYMFYNCYSLTNLNLSNFNTSNATDMKGMFYNCGSLTELDLGSFDTSKVTSMWGMFLSCKNLKKIIMKTTVHRDTNTDEMFTNCPTEIIQKL